MQNWAGYRYPINAPDMAITAGLSESVKQQNPRETRGFLMYILYKFELIIIPGSVPIFYGKCHTTKYRD